MTSGSRALTLTRIDLKSLSVGRYASEAAISTPLDLAAFTMLSRTALPKSVFRFSTASFLAPRTSMATRASVSA